MLATSFRTQECVRILNATLFSDFYQVDVGHLELRCRKGAPRQIETITVLPEARKKSVHRGSMPLDECAHICLCRLSPSIQRMRAYPDGTDLMVYQGTLALAKRHLLPEGSKPRRHRCVSLAILVRTCHW